MHLWPQAEAHMGQHGWRLRQLWAEGAGSLCLESSWTTVGFGTAGHDETGQTGMADHGATCLLSVSTSSTWEHQNTAQKVLLKYLRAFGQEIKGHVDLVWVNPLLPTDGGRKKVSLFAHRTPTHTPEAGGREGGREGRRDGGMEGGACSHFPPHWSKACRRPPLVGTAHAHW